MKMLKCTSEDVSYYLVNWNYYYWTICNVAADFHAFKVIPLTVGLLESRWEQFQVQIHRFNHSLVKSSINVKGNVKSQKEQENVKH